MTRVKRANDLLFIATVSAAILAYELLLTRILSVHYWSYFASMIVSLAMLGFAASGTALVLISRTQRGTNAFVPWVTLGFAFSVPLCPRLAESIHCLPLVVLWDPKQFALFAANYLVLCVPFLLGGFVVGHFFLVRDLPAGRVYFANMLGSGAGVLVALAFLCGLPPVHALCLTILPVIAAAWPRAPRRAHRFLLAAVVPAVGLVAWFGHGDPVLSEYKAMRKLLLMPDARVEYSAWNRFGYLTVVESDTIRYAPGLSLMFAGTIPPQKAIFVNGDDMQAVCAAGDDEARKNFFDSMLGGLAYRFHKRPRVLVIGAGGGMNVLGGLVHDAERIDALEGNTGIARVMNGPLADFAGDLYAREGVRLQTVSARAYAGRTTNRYDVVLLPAQRSFFASAAGTSAQDPDYLLTRESLSDFAALLRPGGVLAMETWLDLPPRQGAKLFATAAACLRKQGLPPDQHLLSARSLRTYLVLLFRDPITPARIEAARQFCASRSFDLVHYPGIDPEEVNRFNSVSDAPYHALALELLKDPEAAYRRHPFRIRPAGDDRPYFSHFFKWAALPQLLAKTGRNVAVHVGWGYMFILITLVQAVPLGAAVILLPLALDGHRQETAGSSSVETAVHRRSDFRPRSRVAAYFSALGLGFMFFELAAIQQFARFLPHPVYAFGIVVGLVLLSSGLGAWVSTRSRHGNQLVFSAIPALIFVHLALWQLAIHYRSPAAFRCDIATVALLAFFMGMPFPRGIERLRACAPRLVPWAWGVNGFVSVLAVLAAGVVSLSWGLSALVALAAVSYVAAGLSFPPAAEDPTCRTARMTEKGRPAG